MATAGDTDGPVDHTGAVSAGADSTTGHAFISYVSYVRDDSEHVDDLQKFLEAQDIPVWRDRNKIWPGDNWKDKIRQAIRQGSLAFVVCFSKNSVDRVESFQNEEIALAAEEARSRRPDQPWIFPVRFDDVDISKYDVYDLGAGDTLGSLHRSDIFGDSRDAELARLAAIIKRVIPTGDNRPPVKLDRRPGRGRRLLPSSATRLGRLRPALLAFPRAVGGGMRRRPVQVVVAAVAVLGLAAGLIIWKIWPPEDRCGIPAEIRLPVPAEIAGAVEPLAIRFAAAQVVDGCRAVNVTVKAVRPSGRATRALAAGGRRYRTSTGPPA